MRMTRPVLTAVSVVAAGALLSACGGGNGGGGAGEGGGTLYVTLSNHPWTTVVQDKIADFESETGIDVEVTVLGEDQLSDQYNVKLNAGATDVDVMMMRPLQEAKLFSSNGWLLPLDDLIADAGDWNWDDFQMQSAVTTEEGVVAVPIVTEQEVLYYRTDLLEAAGLDVPQTLDELRDAAATIQEQNDGVYGFVARGQRAALVTQFSSYLYAHGADWDDGEGTATIDTAEAKQAYEYYASMLSDYGPPGVTNMSWKEASAIFQQGQAAFYTDASVFYNNMIDPEQSRIGDTFGVAQMPAGPDGSAPYSIPSWGLAINQASRNVDNAWRFIEWATSPEMTKEIQVEGVAGARTSVWEDAEGTSAFPDELAEVIRTSMADGVDHDRPVVVEVGRARDIVGAPVIAYLDGQDLDAALARAQEEYQALLDDEG